MVIRWAEETYGTYRPRVREDVRVYVATHIAPAFYFELVNILKRIHETKYKTPPDIAVIEKARKELQGYLEFKEANTYKRLPEPKFSGEVQQLLSGLVDDIKKKNLGKYK